MKYQGILAGTVAVVLVAGVLPVRKEPEPAVIEEHVHRDPFNYQPTKPGITVVVTSTSNNTPHYGDFQQDTPDLTPITFHSIIR
jgi:hypothetical protein